MGPLFGVSIGTRVFAKTRNNLFQGTYQGIQGDSALALILQAVGNGVFDVMRVPLP